MNKNKQDLSDFKKAFNKAFKSETYSFGISGTPVAKARPRGFKNKAGQVRMYTPKKSKDFEYAIRQRAEAIFEKPLTGPISLEVTFFLPRPKAMTWKKRPMPAVPNTVRPDLTNFIKSCEDGLNGIAYLDDGQIARLKATKYYHEGGKGPWTQIEIREMEVDKNE